MNEEIKALIEREAEKRAGENYMFDSSMSFYIDKGTFKRGANFALSLFRWRKVEEEDIPINRRLVLRLGNVYTLIIISDEELASYAKTKWKDGEWMPIPNN